MLTHKSRFLLAALHMESLSREDNVRDIRESLRKLPEDLDSIYDEALQRIKRQDRQKVARADQVLTLINCAYRPLQIREIQYALAVRPGDTFTDLEALPRVESVLSACCGLVVVEGESQVVRLVHYTTEEYFTRKNQYRSPAAHLTIAGTLITYLKFTTFATFPPAELKQLYEAKSRPLNDGEGSDRHNDSGESRGGKSETDNMDDGIEDEVNKDLGLFMDQYLFEKNALLRYAVQHWGDHAREAFADFQAESYAEPPSPQLVSTNAQRGSVNSTWDAKELILNFLEDRANIRCAHDALSYLSSTQRWPFNFNFTNIHPHTPSLQIVSAFGIHYMVKQYLKQGANIDEKDPKGRTALHRAAENDHVGIVQLLLDSGCVVELQDAAGYDALNYSVRAGSLAAVRMLLNGRLSNEATFLSF
jgi:Ankyrin repeats (3 copies)